MGIKKQSDGTFMVSYSKRHPVTRQPVNLRRRTNKNRSFITSLAEAKRVEKELIIKVEQKLHEKTVPKWNEVIEEYLEDCRFRGLSEKTITGIQICTNAHTESTWGNRFIDSISRDEVVSLHKQAVGDKSQGHQKYMLKCFRLIFNFAIDQGYVSRSPVPMMKFKDGHKIMPVLNEEQVRKFLNRARELDDEWYYHWTLALYTGMRTGELYALIWENVNLDASLIYVKGGWDSKSGFKDYTKSGDDRVVSISSELLLVLKELKLKSKGDYFVLPRLREWDKGMQAIQLRKFLVGIGLPEIRFHDLRATWATLLLSKGVEAIKVMNMGGWKDYKTMMIYIRKAGIDIRGGTDVLKLHDAVEIQAEVIQIPICINSSQT